MAGVRRTRWWYEDRLGWETAPGIPVRLRTGVRFDVLDVPAEAGRAALRRLDAGAGTGGPVALRGDRMLLLVAAGSTEELPGLLEWLEWGSLPLDLSAIGAGGLVEAPLPYGLGPEGEASGEREPPGAAAGGVRGDQQGAAVWLRPPEPGREVEDSLPALSAVAAPGGAGSTPGRAPDLARLVDTVATHCHRLRLRGAAVPRSQR
jgi:hypothetical protein